MNILPIILSTVWAMAVGFFWYSMSFFGKPWLKAAGLKEKDLKMSNSESGKLFGTTILLNIVAAILFSMFVLGKGELGMDLLPMNLILVSVWWVVFTLIPTWVTNLFNRKPLVLTFITTGYQLVVFLGFAVIFSYFN